MVGGISGTGSYYRMYHYGSVYGNGAMQARRVQRVPRVPKVAPVGTDQVTEAVGRVSGRQAQTAQGAQPGTQVQSGQQAGRVSGEMPAAKTAVPGKDGAASAGLFIRKGADPAEYAVRMRMKNLDPEALGEQGPEEAVAQAAGAGKEYDDGKCETCEKRKYQDGSNDMGVSFKTPTHVAPEAAASAVRSHEQEHVSREQAKAKREDRHVVSQSVTLHTSVCPECGRVYISGGVTRTTTAANQPKQDSGKGQPERRPFSAVA